MHYNVCTTFQHHCYGPPYRLKIGEVQKSSRSGPSPPNRRSVARFMDDQGGMLTANDMANLYHKHGHSNVQVCVCSFLCAAFALGMCGFGWLVVLRLDPVKLLQ